MSGGQTVSAKSAMKTSKKIDMGAASNFGRDELGINSPTHRNTHAEDDLFDTGTNNKADLLDDIFKTCATSDAAIAETASAIAVEDEFFNPRADDANEFGDFASAFGGAASTATTSVLPSTAASTGSPPMPLVDKASDSKSCDFADFSAFDGTQTPSNTAQDSADLLFSMNASNSNAQPTASNSNQKIGDLLSDLDGLSLNVPVPSGECGFSPHYLKLNVYACLIVYMCPF